MLPHRYLHFPRATSRVVPGRRNLRVLCTSRITAHMRFSFKSGDVVRLAFTLYCVRKGCSEKWGYFELEKLRQNKINKHENAFLLKSRTIYIPFRPGVYGLQISKRMTGRPRSQGEAEHATHQHGSFFVYRMWLLPTSHCVHPHQLSLDHFHGSSAS
ncbi:hypothetical protein LZ31DRAFT_365110 [Colletotrichum somersetense]|nr:hypothetical protein LZ31DRAFT_365110 [Colletotrichum somersetense]